MIKKHNLEKVPKPAHLTAPTVLSKVSSRTSLMGKESICNFCGFKSDKLLKVVTKLSKTLDTSTFAYRTSCPKCIEEKQLQENIVGDA
jgi:hypothetical protein